MINENPDTERRPRPGGETRVEQRSASQVALQALDNVAKGAEIGIGGLVAVDLYAKAKGVVSSKGDGSNSNDSED